MKILAIICFSLASFPAFSDNETSPLSKVNRILSYTEYGQGDVIIKLESNGQQCEHGYWLRPSDPGFQANLSTILSAYHAQSNVILKGEPSNLWPGSSGSYCHIYQIDLRRS